MKGSLNMQGHILQEPHETKGPLKRGRQNTQGPKKQGPINEHGQLKQGSHVTVGPLNKGLLIQGRLNVAPIVDTKPVASLLLICYLPQTICV